MIPADPDRRFAAVALTGTFFVSGLAGVLGAVSRSVVAATAYELRVGDSGFGAAVAWWLLPVVVGTLVIGVVAASVYAVLRSDEGHPATRFATAALAVAPTLVLSLFAPFHERLYAALGRDTSDLAVPLVHALSRSRELQLPLLLGLPLVLVTAVTVRKDVAFPWIRLLHVRVALATICGFVAGILLGSALGDALVTVGGAGW